MAVTRANAIWRLSLLSDGGVSKVGTWIQFSGGLAGPDGLALDIEGGVVVALPGMRCGDSIGSVSRRIGSIPAPGCLAPMSPSGDPRTGCFSLPTPRAVASCVRNSRLWVVWCIPICDPGPPRAQGMPRAAVRELQAVFWGKRSMKLTDAARVIRSKNAVRFPGVDCGQWHGGVFGGCRVLDKDRSPRLPHCPYPAGPIRTRAG